MCSLHVFLFLRTFVNMFMYHFQCICSMLLHLHERLPLLHLNERLPPAAHSVQGYQSQGQRYQGLGTRARGPSLGLWARAAGLGNQREEFRAKRQWAKGCGFRAGAPWLAGKGSQGLGGEGSGPQAQGPGLGGQAAKWALFRIYG